MVQYARELGIDQMPRVTMPESVMTLRSQAAKAVDRNNQSYFCDLTQELLAASLFPANRSKRKLDVLQLSLD